MEDMKKRKRLEWFMDFMALDPAGLSAGERAKWVLEVEELTSPSVDGKAPADLAALQGRLKRFYGAFLAALKRAAARPGVGAPPVFGELPLELTVRLEGRPSGNEPKGPGRSGALWVALALDAPAPEDALLFQLVRLLEGLPLEAFGECAECGRWFVNPSRREKSFCSNNCAARFGVRRRRALEKRVPPPEEKPPAPQAAHASAAPPAEKTPPRRAGRPAKKGAPDGGMPWDY